MLNPRSSTYIKHDLDSIGEILHSSLIAIVASIAIIYAVSNTIYI
jgi:hypothetical protein